MRLYVGLFAILFFILFVDVLFYYVFLRKIRRKKPITYVYFSLAITYLAYWSYLFLFTPEAYSYEEPDNYYLYFAGIGVMMAWYFPRLIALALRTILFVLELLRVSKRKTSIWISMGFGLLIMGLVLSGIFIIRFQFRVIKQEVVSKHVPAGFNGYKIAQISDTHLGTVKGRQAAFDELVKKVNGLNADLVVFTGDIINNFASELNGWDTVFKKITAPDGVYAILGNHDYGDYVRWVSPRDKRQNFMEIVSFFDKINWDLLRNEYRYLVKENDTIVLSGVENWGHPPFPQYGDLRASLPDTLNHPVVLLSHDPSHWGAEVKNHEADIFLMLAGHTHGFQFGVRSENFNWSPVSMRYKEWGGMHKYKDRYMYINIGLGTIGFPGRVGMRPEITLITLKSDDSGI